MSDTISGALSSANNNILRGTITGILPHLYEVAVGSTTIIASSAISDVLAIGSSVVLGEYSGMHFIIGAGSGSVKEPTIFRISG